MFLIFYFWSWIFDNSSEFWATLCKNESNLLLVSITVCIESCLPIGWRTFIWWKKIRQSAALFWCGLRNYGIFYLRAAIQRTIDISSTFWSTVQRKRSWFEHMQTEQAGGLEAFLHEAAQNFEGLSNSSTLMQIQSGRTVPLRYCPARWEWTNWK